MLQRIVNYCKIKKSEKILKKVFSIGFGTDINHPISIFTPENLFIEDYVYIGSNAWISCFASVRIRRGTIIGPRLKIYTANHKYDSNIAIPYDNIVLAKSVEIGENVWVGGDVIIMPGVTIGEGCVIAGGAVVTKKFPPLCIIGGNPATIIKERDKAKYFRLKADDKIYLKMKQSKMFTSEIHKIDE